jgi:hypothetical protein
MIREAVRRVFWVVVILTGFTLAAALVWIPYFYDLAQGLP